MTKKCNWFAAWQHRRRRTADLKTMWPALVMRAPEMHYARKAWTLFTQQEGQEHWRCECSQEVSSFMESFHWLADAKAPFGDGEATR